MATFDVKPSSNRKPAGKAEAPNEPFKRAIASCTRAMARDRELEIAFTADKPALVRGPEGARARLPEPPRKPNPREAAILRGLADSMALRLACHNEAIHRRYAPLDPASRALFDAVEQTRVEAIGARRMEGVASNLTAMLDDRYHRSPFAQARDRDEAPLEDAVAMLVRESTTHDAVLQVVKQTKPANLETVELFDVFRGKNVPEGQKSLAYAFTYRAADKTLTDAEVNAAHAKVVDAFKAQLKATVRE